MFKNRCYNGGERHKFKARYSLIKREAGTVDFVGDMEAFQKYNNDKIYHGDICVWCGQVRQFIS